MSVLTAKLWMGGAAALLITALLLGCAPASGGGDGVGAGDAAPPFSMQLADGSEVTLKKLVDAERPALLMFFATW